MIRFALLGVVLLLPGVSLAQTPAIDTAVRERVATLKWVYALQDPETGGFRVEPKAKPGLRATSGAVRAIKYLGGKLSHPEKVTAFVMGCYDPKTGSFAEPGGQPDVTITSVGVMAAIELDIPKEKFAKAMDYLKANAKTFEDVRIAAAAVEAWGVKEAPFDLAPWFKVGSDELLAEYRQPGPADGRTRRMASAVALIVRLGFPFDDADGVFVRQVNGDQRADGGWGKAGEKTSDLETTYRVMRAMYLLKSRPQGADRLRQFIRKCRNTDGGYGVTPGAPSTMSGVYYAAVVSKWLNEMEKH